MLITYYGTGAGAGIPEMFCSCRVCEYARKHGGPEIRTRSQATVDDLMIDFSVDTFGHCVYRGLDMRNYRNVLITHAHFDHYMHPELVSRFTDYGGGWTFYLPSPAYQQESKWLIEATSGPQKDPPRVSPRMKESIPFTPMQVGSARVTPLPSQHAPAVGSVIYLIEKDGKNLLWVHDSGLLLPETEEYLKKLSLHLDAVSLDCTLKRNHCITPNHMDILRCDQTAKFLRDIDLADDSTIFIISHIGHLLEKTHHELEEEAAEFGFLVAYDGFSIEI